MKIDDWYNRLCSRKCDINEHLPILKKYSEKSNSIVEMGVRTGISTSALLAGRPKIMISYDLGKHKGFNLDGYKNMSKEINVDYRFIESNVLDIQIEPVDLLFIDTYHTYEQLKQELKLHGNKAQKYIILHDTVTFGDKGEDGNKPGLNQAVNEFIKQNTHWSIKEVFKNNNGLTILERKK